MKLSELNEGVDYTLDKTGGAESPINVPVLKQLGAFGGGLGGAVAGAGFGLSELALKAAAKVTGSQFLGQAAGVAKELREEVGKTPDVETVSGKIGEFAGIGATFLAPSRQLLSAQKITSALAEPITKLPYVGRLAGFGARALPEAVGAGAVEYGRTGGDIESAKTAALFTAGGMGVLGEFESTRPPTIDMLSISADTADILGVLDLVQVRAGPG